MHYHDQELITKLSATEVFVFGSNEGGFHGAGSAGFAFKGTAKNDWRENKACKAAMYSHNPQDRIGKWAVWGQARGFQQGTEGKSYAIVTTEAPKHKGRVTLESIQAEIRALAQFATDRPDLTFLCAPFGLSRKYGGYSWFTPEEIHRTFADLEQEGKLPSNLHLHRQSNPEQHRGEPELPFL